MLLLLCFVLLVTQLPSSQCEFSDDIEELLNELAADVGTAPKTVATGMSKNHSRM